MRSAPVWHRVLSYSTATFFSGQSKSHRKNDLSVDQLFRLPRGTEAFMRGGATPLPPLVYGNVSSSANIDSRGEADPLNTWRIATRARVSPATR